jgi:hypothetical protein
MEDGISQMRRLIFITCALAAAAAALAGPTSGKAWSGLHLREVERYTRAADQARLARNALARTQMQTGRNVTDAVTKSSAR